MRIYTETYGCQMNEYDSRVVGALLSSAGHELVGSVEEADAVIVNTCAVRERAERRVLGRLQHLRGLKGREAVIGVIGCVAQRLGAKLLKEGTSLDFVVGTDQYERLPEILEAASRGLRTAETTFRRRVTYERTDARERATLCEFVSVMRGCDNFCSYCIVPYVRGRERSRPFKSVIGEVRALAESGTREVTLVGQNVNSYRDGAAGFAEVLRAVAEVPKLSRVRFATSHPKDLSDGIIDCVAGLPAVCEHIHLPVQSGSDRILAAMNRSYTRAEYEELAARIRDRIPGVALTTDVIVGFPGESECEFGETLSLMEELRFESAFMFRYSVRAGTAAAELLDDVAENIKIKRLEEVIALQKRITEETGRAAVGETHEVLVEGPSQRDASLLFGRTRASKAVVFPGPRALEGRLVRVRIESASAWTLHGAPARDDA
jgi:tRNA-2-methylthio-N6-dimethylallyladenosine synthase